MLLIPFIHISVYILIFRNITMPYILFALFYVSNNDFFFKYPGTLFTDRVDSFCCNSFLFMITDSPHYTVPMRDRKSLVKKHMYSLTYMLYVKMMLLPYLIVILSNIFKTLLHMEDMGKQGQTNIHSAIR